MTIGPGSRLGRYEIRTRLGAGGMAEVYLAEDTELGRPVALKILPPDSTSDPHARKRLLREARAAATLDHPHICAVYDVGDDGGRRFIAMQHVEGETLAARLARRPLQLADALSIAADVADALAAAHARGILHRDIKPSNVMITPRGRAVVLDFGLAKLVRDDDEAARQEAVTESLLSVPGAVLGTIPYMSPEQVRGEALDGRSDVFSLGVVLYEMLTGQRPFEGASPAATASAILTAEPPPVARARPAATPEIERIVGKTLRKNADERYQTVKDLLVDLKAVVDGQASRGRLDRTAAPKAPGGTRLWLGVAATSAVFLAGFGWMWLSGADDRWARNEAIPELERLVRAERLFEAVLFAREIERRTPGHPALLRLLAQFTMPARIDTEPAGAQVELQDYTATASPWFLAGQTPVDLRIPDQPFRVRLTKPGYETIVSAPMPSGEGEAGRLAFAFLLDKAGTAPPGMVRVRGGRVEYRGAPAVDVDDFWIDRLEVTNREYQRFVDAGGYRRQEYWRHPIVDGSRTLSWPEALARFRDVTGQPGPAGWQLGRFPDGAADLPVAGVSWYEASAYAEWAGKALPSYHHWYRASQPDIFNHIIAQSRFGGDGPVAAGSLSGLGPWGTLDMAGNVKEWVSTATGPLRFALGGAWNDPGYIFPEPEAFSSLRRSPEGGFRCITVEGPLSAAVLAPLELELRDVARERPVSDEVYSALVSVYSYDRASPLNPKLEDVDDSSPHWRLERVSIAAAYGGERLPVLLYMPKPARPRPAAVLYLPESTAEMTPSSAEISTRWFEFIVRSGRAVVVPVYKNMFERRLPPGPWSPTWRRDLVIAWSKDLGRTIDYLETRSDVDSTKLGFYGFSLGAVYGPILAALEPRLRAAVLLGGGVNNRRLPPEVEPVNFAPRVRQPVLMIAGSEDFVRPVARSQRPLFALFGAPPDHKRLAVIEGGHLPLRSTDVMREVLAWLDRWLGPAEQP